VYGIPEESPITEDFPVQPISPYGRTKAAVEGILADYAEAYGLQYASLRYFNAAGAMPDGSRGEDHSPETHLIPIVIEAAMGKRKCVTIFGTDYPTPDGTCIRDYIHVLDLGTAHVMALEALDEHAPLIYNLGTGSGHSVREVIDAVQEVSGHEIPVEEGKRRPGDPPALVSNPRKVRSELGWEPRYPDLRTIVETAWKWHSTHPDGYGD
jgi:UDP-glucose 4-epimerase